MTIHVEESNKSKKFEDDVNLAIKFKGLKDLDASSINADCGDIKMVLKPASPTHDAYWSVVRAEADKRIANNSELENS
ncbi:hypothetical protein PVK62_08380 [Aliivibrio sp. S3MY1]|uniref:hypothetical protein n=1 Tax=Aliivibrio sp. S3MY1 TaxID=3028424 RepID=UPI0023790448|nr:hypothetical protein [Aliivibrio sp. S3MY1]MDD9195856.1 hypothetical protein [Aliivibrio sp. S3MY1]